MNAQEIIKKVILEETIEKHFLEIKGKTVKEGHQIINKYCKSKPSEFMNALIKLSYLRAPK